MRTVAVLWGAFLASALTIAAFSQTPPTHVPADEATKHLVEAPAPNYPSLAETARIQGNVILRVRVDESGKASVLGVIRGHPMLAPAATEAVNRWKYRPFEINGKPATVITLVMVRFGKPTADQNAVAIAELLLQAAIVALDRGDWAGAEQRLTKARDLLAPPGDDWRDAREGADWLSVMGRLRDAQHRFDEAEQHYLKALAIYEAAGKDAPGVAATLARLGDLYVEQKRYDLARDSLGRSLAIYQKTFRRAGSGDTGARQAYGREIAHQAWMLSKLALERNDLVDAARQCRSVLEFQTFLETQDHDSFVPACQQRLANAPKN